MDNTEDANQYAGEQTENPEAPREQGESEGHQDNENNDSGSKVIGSAAMRPVFLGNLIPEYSSDKILELFTRPIPPPGATEETYRPIPVDRVDVKRGFCFVFLKDAASQEDKEQAEKFVEALTGMQLAGVSTALRAEFARGDGRVKRKEDDRRRNIQPSETLFVVNFHEETTKQEDLRMLFEPYGELTRIDLKRNYAFVQFRTIDEATRALRATNGGKLDQSVLSVEYVARQRGDQDRRRRRDDHPRGDRRGYDRRGAGGGAPDRFRGGPPPNDRMSRGYGGVDRNDRGVDRHNYDGPPRGPPRDDYRPRGRDRSPGGHRSGSPAGYRPRDSGGYRGERGGSPGGYGRRSRSRSRSPRGGYRSRSPPRRYDDRDGRIGRNDDYRERDGRGAAPGGPAPVRAWSPDGYRDRARSPEVYRGGRDDRGYRP